MSLFLTMLPIYLFGNLHCLGMCGPLVAMIGHHRFRWWYFAGRCASFAAAGFLAGFLGAVLNAVLHHYHIPALTSLLFGSVILAISLGALLNRKIALPVGFSNFIAPSSQAIATLLLKDRRWPTFLFGLATVLLPCGQTIIVFSACALEGDALIGLFNGFAFALITSPSLVLAMHATSYFSGLRPHYNTLMGVAGLFVGMVAFCRGLAELQVIPHLVFYPASSSNFHIALF